MSDSSLQPLVRDYLKRLKKAARRIPRARRKELVEEIESHLSEALPADASEAEALNVLERLGEPAEIVAEAGAGQAPATRAGLHEWLTIPLLLIGGFIVIIGWLVGVVLLWTSRVWTLRDKLIGTLVIPGGLATTAFFFFGVAGTRICSGISSTRENPATGRIEHFSESNCPSYSTLHMTLAIIAAILLVVLPVLTAIYLGRRATRAEVVA
ncbi:MAG: hypothetical protein IMZ71_03675 [Chloroflexi bacterium]|nr:hypothetical protein [Chloroflexota bacterium]